MFKRVGTGGLLLLFGAYLALGPAGDGLPAKKGSPTGDVAAHGAKGDGTADDTAAVQKAVNAGAGVVRFGKGTYRLTKTVVIDLVAKEQPNTAAPVGPPAPKRGGGLLLAGGVVLGAGVVAHLWMGFEHGKLEGAQSVPDYNAHETRYDVARISTIALYAGAVGLLAPGAILRMRSPERATISAIPLDGGAMVSVRSQR